MKNTPRVRKRFRFALQAALAFSLWFLTVICAGRILQRADLRLDLGGRDIATLSPSTRAFLSDLKSPLSLTYFVSAPNAMPSHLKGVEREVRRLLDAFRREAPEWIDYRVLNPGLGGKEGAAYAAKRSASPFSARDIRQDERSEQKVWSSLVLSYAESPDVLIQEIVPEDLPRMEALTVQNLKALETPVEPVFAVAAPASFLLLPSFLREYGQVIEVDLDLRARIPPEADILFWVQPSLVTDAHVKELRRFIASGRTAVLAGSPYAVDVERSGETVYRARLLPSAWESLLFPLGLTPRADLLTDENTGPVAWTDGEGRAHDIEAPFYLRCLPAYRNNKSLAAPAMGGLLFDSAGALAIDPLRVNAAGFRAEVIATTTDKAHAASLPQGVFLEINPTEQIRVGKQNLAVLLNSADRWKGQILALSSASLFRDDLLAHTQYAHRRFLQVLARTFAGPQRLVRARIERPAPPTLPALGSAQRVFWRGLGVVLVPLALLLVGFRRYLGKNRLRVSPRIPGRIFGRAACALGAVLLATQVIHSRLYLDLTADASNTLRPLTREIVDRNPKELRAELFLTSRALLPASMKAIEPRLGGWLRNLGIPFLTVRPETLSDAGREALLAQGVRPFEARAVRGDSAISQQVWSALILTDGKAAETIPRLDTRSLDHFEFLLAAAIHRLKYGREPHVGVISDSPRLSPAEAYEDFQKQGLSAPRGADVYSEVKELLRNYGYRVSNIDRPEPEFPDDMDLLLWMQPRRDAGRLILRLSEYLSSGGKAIVALQHFNIQQRQYRGSGFKTVYWPQPQFQDLERYLNLLGVKQVREVLMDRTRSRLSLETQVNRGANREYDDQEVALPFLIRATGESFSRASPVTKNLGDLLFVWGNRFSLDRERLEAMEIKADVLVTTTPRAWSYAWEGGWLPEEVFNAQDYLPGPQPLSVLLKGKFPRAELTADETRPELRLQTSGGGRKNGELFLIGCSEMLKNEYLYAPGFHHAQFLLNAVAHLTFGREIAGLQARGRTVGGFPFQTPEIRIAWRALVVGFGPFLLFLYGVYRYLNRHRSMKL